MPESIDNQRRGFLSRVAKPVQQLKAEAEVHQRTMPRPPRAVQNLYLNTFVTIVVSAYSPAQIALLKSKKPTLRSILITTPVLFVTPVPKFALPVRYT